MTQTTGGPYRELIDRYVIATPAPDSARYLRLLDGALLQSPDREQAEFLRALGRDARQITDADLRRLLLPGSDPNWRERLTAAWLAATDRRVQFREILAGLLNSDFTYAGQGYALALTRFGQPEDADILGAYLDRHLPQTHSYHDHDWVLGGLLHLDEALGTIQAGRFLVPGGPWSRHSSFPSDPVDCRARIAALIRCADRAMAAGA
ncbi:DUF6000 family protein [Bailinhaonella thermotolerans]|nr:DUF6000 family protein [Bailinhaonella thermotolerans]